MRKFLLIVLFSLISYTLHLTPACAAGVGTRGGAILTQPISARVLGMGEAFVGVADDAAANWYNPAGLTWLVNPEVTTMYRRGLVDASNQFLAGVLPVEEGKIWWVSGLSVVGLQGGEIEVNWLEQGSPAGKEILKSQSDKGVCFSQQISWKEWFGFGVNLKYISSRLAERAGADTFAVDLAGMVDFSLYKIGLVIRNLGPGLEYENVADDLPTEIRLGGSYWLVDKFNHRLLVAADLNKPFDDSLKANLGIEYSAYNLVSIRAGYKLRYDLEGFTFGLGVKWKQYQLDYAAGDLGELGWMHCVNFGYRFGLTDPYHRGLKYYQKGFYDHAQSEWGKVSFEDPGYWKMMEMLRDIYQIKKWKR